MDVSNLVPTIVLSITTLGAGAGWLRTWELRRIGEQQAEADVAATKVNTEVQSIKLFTDTLAALEASNKATLEANHYSDDMRNECARLRGEQTVMRAQLEECIAARATGAANVARLTQAQVEAKAEIAVLRTEIVALRAQMNGTPND